MRELLENHEEDMTIGELAKRKLSMFITIGCLILNLVVFAIAIPQARIFSFIIAAVFLVYMPIGLIDRQVDLMMWVSRILEILITLAITVAYIILYKKYLLFILPAVEIIAGILFYLLVYRTKLRY